MGRKKLPDRVISVGYDGNCDKFKIRWCEGGRLHQTHRKTEEDAAILADDLRARLSGTAKPSPSEVSPLPMSDMDFTTHSGWVGVLQHAAQLALTKESQNLRTAQVISGLAQAAVKFLNNTALEKRVAMLEAEDKGQKASKKYGARAKRATIPTREAPVPGEPVS